VVLCLRMLHISLPLRYSLNFTRELSGKSRPTGRNK
jgi:hypothetical protein